jgi:FKBP-type peptidyl-prolyl cis-trans isomerase FkpA
MHLRQIRYILLIFLLSSCSNGFHSSQNGLRYKLFPKGTGTKGNIDDVVVFRFRVQDSQDSIIADNFKNHDSVVRPVNKPMYKGDPEELFTMMGKGDSAVSKVKADLFYGDRCPQTLKGKTITMTVKVLEVKKPELYKKERQEKFDQAMKADKESRDIEEKTLEAYVKMHDPRAIRSETGIYYRILNPGQGPALKNGDVVWAHFSGRLLDGKVFDTDSGKAEPLKFYYGRNSGIKGFQEGIEHLKKGAKAILYIPSRLGYGKKTVPNIPPNSSLIFTVEIMDVK